ncbi:MAG: type II secretion system F family protein [Sedimentisphaerales bacterium]|nr:type II secretion system F family protein [Sedimentisphaerales bacterium]
MKLAYTAYDQKGEAVAGTIDSANVMTATETLRSKGLFVANINESAATPVKVETKRRLNLKGGNKAKNLTVFTRQLSVLVRSGSQLSEALEALEKQAKQGPWRAVIADLNDRVKEGAALSEAMESNSQYFDPVYCSLIATGESSGHLVDMLDRLASLKQKQLRIRNSIIGAMIYPIILVTLSISIFILLMIFVVPRFSTLFETLDVPLPASTQILVNISEFIRSYWWIIGICLTGALIGLITFLRTPKGKRSCDTILLRMPCIGNIAQNLITARVVFLLGVLMEGHVKVLEALRLVRRAAGNAHYSELISKAEKDVSEGEQLSLAFSDPSLINPCVHAAIQSGEQSGQLDRLLLNIAGFLDEENETILRSLTSIIEPLILVIMGVLVGLIAVSMFLPLFDLTSMTQGGG